MSKIIVIPEPHVSYKNINGRLDYVSEIKGYISKIYNHIQNDEEINYVIFVGDIFNMGFKDVDEYFYWIDWFKVLKDLMISRNGDIYSVIGNHEISYSKSNPFWRLVSSSDGGFNTKMKWNDKAVSPLGFNSILNVYDILELDNNCSLFFCHYGKIKEMSELVEKHINEYGDSKIRICVSHNSIISDEIVRVLKNNHKRDPLTNYIQYEQIKSLDLFHKFDYVFNGHMHRAYSRFTISFNNHDTKLLYLGSLGRTNSAEIDDSDLDRVCPIFDTDLRNLTTFNIRLKSRMDSLKEGYDEEKEIRVEEKRQYSEVCRKIIDVENPIESLMNAIDDREMLIALECAVDYNRPYKFEEFYGREMELI